MSIAINNQWSMVNGQWSMVNGQWSMVNGQWSMVNRIIDQQRYLLFIIAHSQLTVHAFPPNFNSSTITHEKITPSSVIFFHVRCL